jgi:hypothetical protein
MTFDSQAENASSILVAHSKIYFVATIDQIAANIALGFRHCSPLFSPVRHFSLSQRCRNATKAVHHELHYSASSMQAITSRDSECDRTPFPKPLVLDRVSPNSIARYSALGC